MRIKDGRNTGKFTDVSDLHELAFGFEATMPAGIPRQAFWPDEYEDFNWVVVSKTKKGRNRFIRQHLCNMKNRIVSKTLNENDNGK